RCGEKLVSPEEAVRIVKSGDTVAVATHMGAPALLCQALVDRRGELSNVRIDQAGSGFPWASADGDQAFGLRDPYLTPLHRDAAWDGRVDWVPEAHWRVNEMPRGWDPAPDVAMVTVSPPDRHGFCSFGAVVTWNPIFARTAKAIIAEVHEDHIRTYGDSRIHLS